MLSRFEDADSPSWTAPADDELRQHIDDGFLRVVPPAQLIATLSPLAARLREDLVIAEATPTMVRGRIADRHVNAFVASEAPNRLLALRMFRPGVVEDLRVTDPPTVTEGDVPAVVPDIAGAEFTGESLPGLAVAAGSSVSPVWSLTTGWADLDRAEALRPDHRFPVHAVTKLVTATAVLRLVASGQVALHGTANDHLATIRLADDTVTVADLLGQTGGVVDPTDSVATAVPDLVSVTGSVLACDGTRDFRVSSGSYAALGALITDVTGSPYAEAVARLVFEPLGMRRSGFPTSWPDDAVTGHRLSDGVFQPVPRQVSVIPSAGGLWTTPADLVRFGVGWVTLLPAVLAAAALAPRTERPVGHVGLGWFVNHASDVVGHPGAGTGCSVSLAIRAGRTHVAMTNRRTVIEPTNGRIVRAV